MKASIGNDPESVVRNIRRKTRRKFSVEEKIRIVLVGFPKNLLRNYFKKAKSEFRPTPCPLSPIPQAQRDSPNGQTGSAIGP